MTTIQAGTYTILPQERVIFGKPCADAVVEEAQRLNASRVFLVSTRSLALLTDGPLQRIEKALGRLYAGTFSSVRAHSPREDVLSGAQQARAANADLLVAIGGGSVIDATKAMLFCIWHNIADTSSMEPYRSGADPTIAKTISAPSNAIRMMSVSTTLSASEFTAQAGVTDSASHAKQSFSHSLFVPRTVILDPAATMNTPEWLLFCTGIRAVDHAVESYCSTFANLATEATSLQGLRLLARALPAIKGDPTNLSARMEAQFGMWQSIVASGAGVPMGASHGIGYVLGATYNVAHGHTSCVMLPAVLRWNSAVNADRQRALSAAMEQPNTPAADLIATLIKSLDQPTSLRDVGIQRKDFDAIAARALGYGPVKKNPRPVRSKEDVLEILDLAW